MKDNMKWTGSKVFLIAFNCLLSVAIVISAMVIVIDKSRIKSGVKYTDASSTSVQSVTKKSATNDKGNENSKTSQSARLMCAGDNLVHRSIYNQAQSGDTYDFSKAYEQIKPILKNADIAFLNQESIIDTDSDLSSSPDMNSPKEILDTLSDVGFNVINQATNHCFDMGIDGLNNDIALLKSNKNIMMTGLYSSEEEMYTPQIKEANGIKFSFIGITEDVNYDSYFTDSNPYIICLNDDRYSTDVIYNKIKKMIDNAKQQSDIVCVYVHWDEQDSTEPSENQKEIADNLLNCGADIIIGSGTHTLQPIEFVKNCDGDDALVVWSLGNLITCQTKSDAMLGGIADITVTKTDGKATITSVKLIPTINHYDENFEDVRIIPLSSYTEELAQAHGINSYTDDFTYENIEAFYKEMYEDMIE